MSHKATYWLATLDPKLITAGSFRVLFHLCDHHNDERDPERSCFPSQETLRDKTGLSNGGLNKCIDALESAGLLTRKRSTVPGSSSRRTYYILGCDMPAAAAQTPLSGDSPNSTAVETAPEQTPLLTVANSTFEGGKLHPSGEEPVKEPVIRKKEANASTRELEAHFSDFWDAYPHRQGKKTKRHDAKRAFLKAIKSGATIQQIADGVEALKRDPDTARGYQRAPVTWLNQRGWQDEIPENFDQGGRYDNGTCNAGFSQRPQHRSDPALEQIARLTGLGQA